MTSDRHNHSDTKQANCQIKYRLVHVTVGQLVLFSTETGDAWLLDPADRLATRLARDGESEPIHIEESDTTFAIGWKGRYRIDGPAFVYSDHDTGRVATILGYPTDKLSQIG